jgi:hypothetical protein
MGGEALDTTAPVRFGKARERIGAAVCLAPEFLAPDTSSFVTGGLLAVHGGLAAR